MKSGPQITNFVLLSPIIFHNCLPSNLLYRYGVDNKKDIDDESSYQVLKKGAEHEFADMNCDREVEFNIKLSYYKAVKAVFDPVGLKRMEMTI
mmetsp:Transcript_26468/g.18781  ORF Transcript_26468/g.18781 Transcript_26468/m.18781 type:complete len:93 (+) Transcript_26468:334-612(+)